MGEPALRPPSVDKLARSLADTGLPHPLLVDIARTAIADGTFDSARDQANDLRTRMLQPVINATGVILHTNLGRAPWGADQSSSYRNLELDLTTGQRGSRQAHAGHLLAKAAGAQAAMIVNNCAAAVLLVLAALAKDRGVVVSRGELVEIGGGFRVPDVLQQSGARLIEVGTTNRTRVADFERAVADNDDVALLLQVHQSNYKIVGFTEGPSTSDLAKIGPSVVVDIGSGLLDSNCPWLEGDPPSWLAQEPAARQTLEAGARLVMFSGDKLLGGPQAGIIAGDASLIAACAKHPLARALRPGGLVLGELQRLALAYLERDGASIPFWRMATASLGELTSRATAIASDLTTEMSAVPGGGTLPGVEIPSAGLQLSGDRTDDFRTARRPVMARVNDDTTYLDLRTVDPSDDEYLAELIAELR